MRRATERGSATHVLIAHSRPLLGGGIEVQLDRHEDLSVVARSQEGRQLVAQARVAQPDVIVCEDGLPDLATAEIVRRLDTPDRAVPVVLLSASDQAQHVVAMVAAGVRGYVLDSVGGAELATAVRAVAIGGAWFDPRVAVHLADSLRVLRPAAPAAAVLSSREREVLILVNEGRTNRAIAEELFLSVHSVKTHMERIFKKLGVRSRTAAARTAAELGLLGADRTPP